VPSEPPVHAERDRAESFGSVAEQYDRYRPSYPDQLIAELANLAPERTLDVACGTGKVAVPLLACGLAVLGVEVDPKMADVARRHGIIVEVSAFETWDDDGRRFDLITCGQGWHWIDPERGAQKAADLLVPDGTLALFWNYGEVTDGLKKELDTIYRELAPTIASDAAKHVHDDEGHVDVLKASGRFADVRTERFRWDSTLTADEWIARASTHSDHIVLPDEQRTALLKAVRAAIDKHDGTVEVRGGTYTIFARTPDKPRNSEKT
jgi:SAM-dependent methyltransferase